MPKRLHSSFIRRVALVAGLGCVGLGGAGFGCSGSSQDVQDTTPTETQIIPEEPPAAPLSAVEQFDAECREGLNAAKEALPALLAVGGLRDEQNLLVPYNQMLVDIERSAATAGLMDAVHPDEAIRTAAQACEQEASSFVTELSLHRGLYDAFSSIDTKGLDAETKRLVERTLRDYRRAGVDKDEDTRTRLKEIDEAMVKLGQEFGKNIVDDVREIEVASADLLKGLPEDYIEGARAQRGRQDRHHDRVPGHDSVSRIRRERRPSQGALHRQQESRRREQREDAHRAAHTSCRESQDSRLRQLGRLHHRRQDDEERQECRRSSSSASSRPPTAAPRPTTKSFWRGKRRTWIAKPSPSRTGRKCTSRTRSSRRTTASTPRKSAPTSNHEAVQKGLLDVTAKMYGIEYKPATDAKLWHEDVSAFDVMRDGNKIGRIFLDMHPREGKYGHAAQFPYRSGVTGIQVPEGALVCNFPNPRTTEGPALMEHAQVTTMFHEFGHLMHHVLGGQRKWISQSGVATEWDFVEAPSQMFEEWAWDHEILSGFAKSVTTGEAIPKEMVERMRRADKFGVGIRTLQQMFYASVSLKFHQADPATLDMGKTVKELQTKLTPFAFVEGTKFQSNFGHLNGYSAIYYTYMWSMVIAKDSSRRLRSTA